MIAPRTVRVLVVDDNRIVRRGLRLRLDNAPGITVIGEAGTGDVAVSIAQAERPDVILMDLHMPEMDGIEATAILTRSGRKKRPKVVMLTSDVSDRFVVRAMDAGAVGYLLKNHDTEGIVQYILSVASGDAPISPSMTPRLLKEFAKRRGPDPDEKVIARLSAAERRVVEGLASGLTGNDELAESLALSRNTVRTHVAAAMKKVGVDDRTKLALWAIRNGLDRLEL